MIVSLYSLIDVVNFCCVWSRYLKMIQHDKIFLSRRKLITSIIVFDDLFKFLNCQFQVLSQNICSLYKPLIPFDYNYWYNIFEKRSIKTKYEKWPFQAFFHLFYRHRGSKSTKKYSYCVPFFVGGKYIASCLDRRFRYFA